MGICRAAPSTWAPLICLLFGLHATGQQSADDRILNTFSADALKLHQQAHFSKAAHTFQKGAEQAERFGRSDRAAKFWNAAGAAHMSAGHLRDALEDLKRVEPHLLKSPNAELSIALAFNMASLYLSAEDFESAAQKISEAKLRCSGNCKFGARLLVIEARLSLNQGRIEDSLVLQREALYQADSGPDWELKRSILLDIGAIELKRGQIDRAQAYVEEAHRIQFTHKLQNRERSLRLLADVYMAQNRLDLAERFNRQALAATDSAAGLARRWRGLLQQARVQHRQGQLDAALDSYRRANNGSSLWRTQIVPTITALLESDVRVADLAREYSALAAQIGCLRKNDALLAESLMANERQRAASVLSLSNRAGALSRLGEDYNDLVSQLRTIEMSPMLMRSKQGREESRSLKIRLGEREAAVFPGLRFQTQPSVGAGPEIEKLKERLSQRRAAFSFLLGSHQSWRWCLTREGIQVTPLAPRSVIESALRTARNALASNPERAKGSLQHLGALLFSGLPSSAESAASWHLSLDGDLTEVPWAALRIRSSSTGTTAYLIQGRSVQILPSLVALTSPGRVWTPGKLGTISDAVYNRADPRSQLRERSKGFPFAASFWPGINAKEPVSESPELARLAGSRLEIAGIAKLWKQRGLPVENLEGNAVSAGHVQRLLLSSPSTIHVAAHLVEDQGSRFAPAAIPLSLKPDGTSDALTADALVRLDLPGSLIVLNGCSSSRGRLRGGEGVTSFVRSWLLGGASYVVGTLWPVVDNADSLFVRFYTEVLSGTEPTEALRRAQLDLLDRGGWASHPSVWSAWNITAEK